MGQGGRRSERATRLGKSGGGSDRRGSFLPPAAASGALECGARFGPGRAYDYSTYQYRVDPPQFAAACLDAARTMNGIYAQAAGVNRPG